MKLDAVISFLSALKRKVKSYVEQQKLGKCPELKLTTISSLFYYVKDITRNIKKAVVASSLEEIRAKVSEKFEKLDQLPTIHLDSDGTEIDDEEYFRTLDENAELIAVFPGEHWIDVYWFRSRLVVLKIFMCKKSRPSSMQSEIGGLSCLFSQSALIKDIFGLCQPTVILGTFIYFPIIPKKDKTLNGDVDGTTDVGCLIVLFLGNNFMLGPEYCLYSHKTDMYMPPKIWRLMAVY
uniref:CIDE-N domain-containing protein n=1 Tax=Glossina austeni TaxID=7395 RepID=A0A1A9UVK6_GLOAU